MDRIKFYVGVGCMVIRNNKILLGLRDSDEGKDTWAIPGGHIEYGESPIDAAHRELLEEVGMVAEDAYQLSSFTSYNDNIPRVHILCRMLRVTGNKELVSVDGFSELQFFSRKNMPTNLFGPTKLLMIS